MDKPPKKPPCFGDLTTVFPMGARGLRETPRGCMACPHKTACLRRAMGGRGGIDVAAERVDRAYSAGMMGFVQRWSQKKELDRRKKKESK